MGILEGRRALITGGASGIGKATALLFAKEGAAVSVADHDPTGGQETVREIEGQEGQALFVATDVTCTEDCKRAVQQTIARFGGLDVLLNNAGIIIRRSGASVPPKTSPGRHCSSPATPLATSQEPPWSSMAAGWPPVS